MGISEITPKASFFISLISLKLDRLGKLDWMPAYILECLCDVYFYIVTISQYFKNYKFKDIEQLFYYHASSDDYLSSPILDFKHYLLTK